VPRYSEWKVDAYANQTRTRSNPNPNPDPNPNPTTKQHAIVNIQLNIVTWPTYRDKFYETCWCIVCATLGCNCHTAYWFNKQRSRYVTLRTTSDTTSALRGEMMLNWRCHWRQFAIAHCRANLRCHGARLVAKAADACIAIYAAHSFKTNTHTHRLNNITTISLVTVITIIVVIICFPVFLFMHLFFSTILWLI